MQAQIHIKYEKGKVGNNFDIFTLNQLSMKTLTQKYSIQHSEKCIKTSVQDRTSLGSMETLW